MYNNEHNCIHQKRIEIKKGETFDISLASIDQVNHPVSGLIQASFIYPGSAVALGQATREIPAKCTNLMFNAVSLHSSEQLTLYAIDGPCRVASLSKISLDILISFPVVVQLVCKLYKLIMKQVVCVNTKKGFVSMWKSVTATHWCIY